MKPYQSIAIEECGEPLAAIPLERFAIASPHPYVKLGADYGGKSPYYLRQGVIAALIQAQTHLQKRHPHWRIQIFDAYRPLAVQQFMVDFTFKSLVTERNLDWEQLSPKERETLWTEVYQFWASPSDDPATPPPHSTGAAIDVTLVDDRGNIVDMGSPIDEVSPRSHPHHYDRPKTPAEAQYRDSRRLLYEVMAEGGFCRHEMEWWHFSLGDQMWAWQYNRKYPETPILAKYGRWENNSL